MAKAKEKGAFTMNGGAMLEGQAIASYNYWTAED
jgi:shikimate 5-dehydrogenase